MSINKMDKIKETFKHINDYWKEEGYQKCLVEWKQIQPFMSKEQTPFQCGNCNTYWTSVQFINDHDNICPNCDTHCQPMLCNPLNWLSVLEYIDPKYHHYLIQKHNNFDCVSFLNYIKYDITGNITLIGDDFTVFLEGLTMKTIEFECFGFYECESKNAYIYVGNRDRNISTIIYNAWQLFNNNDEIDIKIYSLKFREFYEKNDYEPDRKYLYKYLMKMLIDKVFED